MQSRATPHNLRDRFLLWNAIRESEQIIADSEAGRSARSERAAAPDDLKQRAGLPSSQRSPEGRRKNPAQMRLSARSIREVVRLKYRLGRSHREIAAALGIAVSTVSRHASYATEAGVSWPLPEGMDDAALEAALFPAQPLSQGPGPVRTGRRFT